MMCFHQLNINQFHVNVGTYSDSEKDTQGVSIVDVGCGFGGLLGV